jgi:tripartite-type tricarboxylate transporter receptor subunit TctC
MAATKIRGDVMFRILAAAALGLAAASGAVGQEFPTKPVTIMMPYAAGGPGDTITRIIGAGMGKVLAKQFLVENVAGAGGTIGSLKVAQATPGDGHYLLIMHFGHAANAALYPNLRYDPVTDFEHIGMYAQSPMAIVAKKDFPAKDFKEFVAYLKANQAKIVHGHAGLGSASHMCGLTFLQTLNLKVTTVPYKGTAPALNDLIGGQFDFMCDQTVNIAQPIKGGLIKGYAVPTKTRLAVLPDLPTTAEMGMPDVRMDIWYGMWAPKGTPKPVVDKLSAALRTALKDPEVKGRLTSMGAEILGDENINSEALRAQVAREVVRWKETVKKAGIATN